MLSAVKVHRPFIQRHTILQKQLVVRRPNGTIYGSKYPIDPHSLTYGSATVMVDRPVGSIGKAIRAVVSVQDHSGHWHKIIFPHLPVRGMGL
ncbi:MAG: hypothetical protein ACLP4V_23315 [Methylocella sp.]